MALSPVVNRDTQAATSTPPAAQKKAADQFSRATEKTRSGETASSSGGDGKSTSVKADQSKVHGRDGDKEQGGQQHSQRATVKYLPDGTRVTLKDGHVINRMNAGGSNETNGTTGSQNTALNRQATGSEQLRSPGQASPPAAGVVLTMPRAPDGRTARPGETAAKGSSEGNTSSTTLMNAEAAVGGQQNSDGSSGGGGQKGSGDQGGDTTGGNDSGNDAGGGDQNAGGFGGGRGNINRPTATGASPEDPDNPSDEEQSLNDYFDFNNPDFGDSNPDQTSVNAAGDDRNFIFGQATSRDPAENTASQVQSGNLSPEDSSSGDHIEEAQLSLQERRDQAIANNQGDELSAEITKNIARSTAKTVGAAVDLFGKLALPSLFTNKFIRSAVSQLAQRGEDVPRSEVKQLADAIVGEMIDKALLLEPRLRMLSGAGALKDAAAEAIVDTLVAVSRNVPVPGMDQSVYDAVMGFVASRIVENAGPDQVQADSTDEERLGNPALLRSTTVESLARNSVQVTTAVGNIGKALLTPVGTVLSETSKAAITFGVSAISFGLMTGNFQVLHFESQDKNLSPEEQKLSRIINQPAKNPITAIQVDTPFVDPKYGSKTWLWLDTYASVMPWYFKPALLPGQEGHPPWATTADGRLRIMNLAPAGNVNYIVGIATGTRSVASNEFVAFNAPRFQPQVLTDFGSTNQRKSPIDTKLSFFAAPVSAVRISENIFGPGRVVTGAVLSPITADLSVGTQGVGFTKTSTGMDIVPIAGVSPNPSYDSSDLLYNDIMKLKDSVPFLNGGK
jgi:hypothetical protein